MKRVLARVGVCALVLGLAVQSVVAADGLRRAGKDLVVNDMMAFFTGFGVSAAYSPTPGPTDWIVNGVDGRPEKTLNTAEKLIAYFRTLPAERTARGIFIWGTVTHLKNPKAAQAQMSVYMKSWIANPAWVAASKKSTDDLVAACEREKIDLWVNVTYLEHDLRFTKLTK